MKSFKRAAQLLVLLFAANCSLAQVANLPADEVERRNAAAGFVFARHASLELLIVECEHLLPQGATGVRAVARAWAVRNRLDIEAAHTWVDQLMRHLPATDPRQHQLASAELMRASGDALLTTSRQWFARQAPTPALCTSALAAYGHERLDIQTMASTPGYEGMAEFAQTLKRIWSAPGFQVPGHLSIGPDRAVQMTLIASVDAARAALERQDFPAAVLIYEGMARRGNGVAAQTIGLMYLGGRGIAADEAQAYRWFYVAWTLTDPEGLNSMGIMLRNGSGVQANPRVAYAAFALAAAMTRVPRVKQRADQNRQTLDAVMTPADQRALACMSLSSFDQALRQPMREPSPIGARELGGGARPLGEIVPQLAAALTLGPC